MKKRNRIITAIIASALIASAALPATVYADSGIVGLLTDSPLSYAITGGENGEWEITSEGVDVFAGKEFDNISDCKLHIELTEDYNESMVLGFKFFAGKKEYELNYIMMMAQQHMAIAVEAIVYALRDQHPDEEIPFDSSESGIMYDGGGLIGEMYMTGTFGVPSLSGSVWEAYRDKDGNGEYTDLYSYWMFYSDGTGGRVLDAEMEIGLAFAYEQEGDELLFHLGGADDDTPATFEITEDGVFMTVYYGEEGENAVRMQLIIRPGEDADTFDPFESSDSSAGDFEKLSDSEFVLPGAAATLADANGTAGGNVGLLIDFGAPLGNGFDLVFVFTGADGSTKKVPASYDKALTNSTVFVKVRDLLTEAGVSPDSVSDFRIVNNGGDSIDSVVIGMGRAGATELRFEAAASESDNEPNPATGVGIGSAALLAAGAAALGIASRKRR